MKNKYLNFINFMSVILLLVSLLNLFGDIFMPLKFTTNVNYIIFAIISTIVLCLKNKFINQITILIIISSVILIIEATFSLNSTIDYLYIIIGIIYFTSSIILYYNFIKKEKNEKINVANKIHDGQNLALIGLIWLLVSFIIALFSKDLLIFCMIYSILGLGGTFVSIISVVRFYEFKKTNNVSKKRIYLNTFIIVLIITSIVPFLCILLISLFKLFL